MQFVALLKTVKSGGAAPKLRHHHNVDKSSFHKWCSKHGAWGMGHGAWGMGHGVRRLKKLEYDNAKLKEM
jgi:hypothetical protein